MLPGLAVVDAGPALDYGPDHERVDVCFAVLSPPGERRSHLRVMSRIGQLAQQPKFLTRFARPIRRTT